MNSIEPTTVRFAISTAIVLVYLLVECLSVGFAADPLADFQQHRFVEGGKLYAYRIRRGTGPALVLIPGSFQDTSQWTDVVPELGADWTILLMDLPGHGESWPPPKKDASISDFSDDVYRVTSHARIDRFYVGGHSIGGMIALEMGRAFPEIVRGVISIEGWTIAAVEQDAFGGKSVPQSPDMVARRLAARATASRGWTDQQRSDFAQIWRRYDASEFLMTTKLPVLELWGDRGRPRPAREKLRIPDRPNIDLVWFAGASHSLPLERPKELGREIQRFVTRVESSTVKD